MLARLVGEKGASDRRPPGVTVLLPHETPISKNRANAGKTRTPDGGAYRRQIAVSERDPMTVEMTTRIVEDASPGRMQ